MFYEICPQVSKRGFKSFKEMFCPSVWSSVLLLDNFTNYLNYDLEKRMKFVGALEFCERRQSLSGWFSWPGVKFGLWWQAPTAYDPCSQHLSFSWTIQHFLLHWTSYCLLTAHYLLSLIFVAIEVYNMTAFNV